MSAMKRTRAEHNQDRKLAFIPLWPLIGVVVLLVVVGYLASR
jgi:type VI protein secretion system component VasF